MQYLNRKVLKWLDFVTDVRHLQNTHPVQKLCKNIHLTSFYDVIRDYDVIIEGLLISLYINIIRMSVCVCVCHCVWKRTPPQSGMHLRCGFH